MCHVENSKKQNADGGFQSQKCSDESERRSDDRLAYRRAHCRGGGRGVHDLVSRLNYYGLEQHRQQDNQLAELMKATGISTDTGDAKAMNSTHRGIRGRFSPPLPFQKLLLDKKGSTYFELMLKTLVVITLMLTVISFLSVFTTYLNLNHICRRVVRVVELEGQVSDRAYDVFYRLKQQTGLSPEMEIDDVEYCDGQKIQLRDTFTITMKYRYPFTIFTPSFAPPLKVEIPMKVRIGGMSEHYWKLP
ncbi:DUF4320 family protein [Desulfotomaculum sp. 1211_IL3151]|uniref:DUF4320 family protein n=1 Tax=Desulfotomaculum sp. 1211_IL3151 TaxID=3084055 RepID=UPI002FD8FDC9